MESPQISAACFAAAELWAQVHAPASGTPRTALAEAGSRHHQQQQRGEPRDEAASLPGGGGGRARELGRGAQARARAARRLDGCQHGGLRGAGWSGAGWGQVAARAAAQGVAAAEALRCGTGPGLGLCRPPAPCGPLQAGGRPAGLRLPRSRHWAPPAPPAGLPRTPCCPGLGEAAGRGVPEGGGRERGAPAGGSGGAGLESWGGAGRGCGGRRSCCKSVEAGGQRQATDRQC